MTTKLCNSKYVIDQTKKIIQNFYQLLLQDSWACIQQHDLLFEFQILLKHCNTSQLAFLVLQKSFDQFQLFLYVHL